MFDHTKLLAALNVGKVYWIDDENAVTSELGIEPLVKLLAKRLAEVDSEPLLNRCLKDLKALSDKTIRAEVKAIQETWKEREQRDPIDAIQEALTRIVDLIPKGNDPKQMLHDIVEQLPRALSPSERAAVKGVFDGGTTWQLRSISFSGWSAEGAEILKQHISSDEAALLVVDLQNDKESTLVDGSTILAQWAEWVKSNGAMRKVFVIALTSKFKVTEEIRAGRELTDQNFDERLQKHLPILVLSKSVLQASDNGEVQEVANNAFRRALARLRACILHWDLADGVVQHFTNSVQEAFRTLQGLSIEELLMAVSGPRTRNEGVSEIDTLIRITSVAQRAALLDQVVSDPSLTKALLELRGLSETASEFTRGAVPDAQGISRLRSLEVLSPAAAINQLLSPLCTGDVFEVTRNTKKEFYVLASNICDLMLRGETGTRKLQTGLLVRLESRIGSPPKDDEPRMQVPSVMGDTPFANGSWFVEYNEAIAVSLDVFDLCWMNRDGLSRWVRSETQLVNDWIPSQARRSDSIVASLGYKTHREHLRSSLAGVTCTFRFANDSETELLEVQFDIRRVGRFSVDYARAFADGFARNLARHSFQHDIAA